ncbi:hypothetical protein GBA52_028333 [Prunus armeniaca]|nr:hypothetical protein GBA52_028333 [Prunus armeniaca]
MLAATLYFVSASCSYCFWSTFLAKAQNTKTTPVNVGVVLDFDTRFGKMGLSCINMSLSDFYASHSYYNSRLVLHKRKSLPRSLIYLQQPAVVAFLSRFSVQAVLFTLKGVWLSSAQLKLLEEDYVNVAKKNRAPSQVMATLTVF